jgi:MOSC domain-containing protein YiiM
MMSDSSKPVIVAVNISPGGIPKLPLQVGEVTREGIVGDGHDHDKHNSPLQAISLIDDETLAALRNEGFAVGPGAVGENLTLRGVGVQRMAVGDRLSFAGGVELELTKVRKPCSVLDSISPALRLAAIDRIGMYAKVIVPGLVSPGETVQVRHAAATAV